MLVILYKMCEIYFCLFGVNGSCVKGENERFAAEGLHCPPDLKYQKFHVLKWQTMSQHCTKKCAADAAQ